MAELDEIVQKIMLDGDAEVVEKLKQVGESGEKIFEQIKTASETGANALNSFGTAIGYVGGATAGLVSALAAWIGANDEAIQRTAYLADAFGTTVTQLTNIEAAFAAAGVSTQQFEQFAQRLTTTIAREWPQIAENIRTASTDQESAQERVRSSILRVQEAQLNLARVDEQTSSAITNATLRQEEALIKLQYAARDAYNTMVRGIEDVQGSNLSLEAAEQRLATLQGNPPTEAEKQGLQLREAQLAVEKARQTQLEALQKQQQDQAEAALKQQKAEQEAADAQLKRQTLVEQAALNHQKAELQLQEAVNSRAQAEERAAQQAVKSIPTITAALDGLKAKNQEVAAGFDFSQVSVRNLIGSIINLAGEGDKLPPSGLKVMTELAKVLSEDTNHLIDDQQRLAIVQQLSQRGFASVSTAAADLLHVLERGPKSWQDFSKAQTTAFQLTDDDIHAVEHFKEALETLGNSIDQVNRKFAAAASPVFQKLLEAINESLTSSDGLLHHFVEGLAAVGSAIGGLVGAAGQALAAIDRLLHLPEGSALRTLILSLTLAVAAFATSWAAIPAAIALVVTAVGTLADHIESIKQLIQEHPIAWGLVVTAVTAVVGVLAPIPAVIGAIVAGVVELVTHWDEVKEAISKAWEEGNSGIKWLDTFLHGVKEAYDWVSKIAEKFATLFSGGSKAFGSDINSGSSGGSEGASQGFASGGHVRGPGSPTSDSIPARLSDGEFVMRTAAVQAFGVDFFHNLNNLMVPGFASGGLVGAPARSGSPSAMSASRPLNLTIDGRTFSGLRGPKNVVDDLASYAVTRQTSSAGVKPSWVK